MIKKKVAVPAGFEPATCYNILCSKHYNFAIFSVRWFILLGYVVLKFCAKNGIIFIPFSQLFYAPHV